MGLERRVVAGSRRHVSEVPPLSRTIYGLVSWCPSVCWSSYSRGVR
jgi:hypothetical protein